MYGTFKSKGVSRLEHIKKDFAMKFASILIALTLSFLFCLQDADAYRRKRSHSRRSYSSHSRAHHKKSRKRRSHYSSRPDNGWRTNSHGQHYNIHH